MEAAVSTAAGTRMLVYQDREALSVATAERFAAISRERIRSRGRFAVAFSGGSTPRRFYSLLASGSFRDKVEWAKTQVFWADERCVPPDHDESNYKTVRDILLSAFPLSEGQVHRIRGEADPQDAAQLYEKELRSFFGAGRMPVFDVVILGAGRDGHTASLFPGAAALRERTRLAVPVYLDAPQLNRVTLTLPVLNHAAHVLVLASGEAKADVVRVIFEEGNAKQYPAGLVRPVSGALEWFLDRDAASLVRSGALMRS